MLCATVTSGIFLLFPSFCVTSIYIVQKIKKKGGQRAFLCLMNDQNFTIQIQLESKEKSMMSMSERHSLEIANLQGRLAALVADATESTKSFESIIEELTQRNKELTQRNENLRDQLEQDSKQLRLQVLKTQAVVQKLDMLAKGDAGAKLAELTGTRRHDVKKSDQETNYRRLMKDYKALEQKAEKLQQRLEDERREAQDRIEKVGGYACMHVQADGLLLCILVHGLSLSLYLSLSLSVDHTRIKFLHLCLSPQYSFSSWKRTRHTI